MNFNIRVLDNIFDLIDPTKEIANAADKLQYGFTMLLLGIATVFAVLATIWLSLVIFKFAFQNVSNKEKKPVAAAPVQQVNVTQSAYDEEIVAVIAAAIAMAESEGNGLKFRVVSFRRI